MRILIVSQHFWPETFTINQLASSLCAHGNHVDVLTAKPNYPEGKIYPNYSYWKVEKEIKDNLNIYRVPIILRGDGNYFLRLLNYLSFVLSGIFFGPFLLRSKKYDVIFVYAVSPIFQAIPAILISFIKKARLVIWVQDLWPDSLEAMKVINNKFLLSILKLLVKWIYSFSDLILVQSKAFIKPVKKLAKNKLIKYYPNSIEKCFYDIQKIKQPKEVNQIKGFSIIFAGNVGVGQNVKVILEAANSLKKFKDINFYIIGKGSKWDWLKKQTKSKGLNNLHMLGRFPVETMPFFMNKASVLLATLDDHAVFSKVIPNKIQAYMAVGKPILASLNGEGARVVTESKAGYAIPANDPVMLASSILKIYQLNEKDRLKMGKNGRKYFLDHFEINYLVKLLLQYFESTIKEK